MIVTRPSTVTLLAVASMLPFLGMPLVAAADSSADQVPVLEEVVVTAQKRNERLEDVPVPVTVLTVDSLVQNNQYTLRDYFSRVPGVTLADSLGGTNAIIIRGISTGGFTNPTVGISLDDAPYGASTFVGGGFQVLDLDPSDLSQIEVLRGPQGTLYGASSMGGLLKYVTTDPTFDTVKGTFSAGTQSVRNDDGQGYVLRGSINVPVSDTLALRASAFTRSDPGFIDDPIHHLRGINGDEAFGGRFALLWDVASNVSVKLSVLHQDLRTDARDNVDILPAVKELVQSTFLPQSEGHNSKITFATGTISASWNSVSLTAITGYSHSNVDMRNSIPNLSPVVEKIFGVTGVPYHNRQDVEKFSQEVRLSMLLGQRFTWVLGAFYTWEHSSVTEAIGAADFATGELVPGTSEGSVILSAYPTTYKEFAGFTNLTAQITDRLDVQIGLRQSHNEQTYSDTLSGALFGPTPIVTPEIKTSGSALTYLFTPRYKFAENGMVYVRLASGYRPGGPNYNVAALPVPQTYAPDKVQTYEIGVKTDIVNHRFFVDASVYDIEWKDMQLQLVDPTTQLAYGANAGAARSKGVELTIEAHPTDALRISAWGAWNDATLTELPPDSAVPAVPGVVLPYSARFTANGAVDVDLIRTHAWTVSAGAAYTYVGERFADFASTGRVRLPGFGLADFHIGGSTAGWKVNLYCNNVFDKRGQIGSDSFDPSTVTIVRPLAIGVTFLHDF